MAGKMTDKQCNDAGLALVFIVLLMALYGNWAWALPVAAALVLLLMIIPWSFAPWARAWFGLSHAIGSMMSRVLLTLVFFVVVAPIAALRRMMGKDPMRLKQWKAGDGSVFREREGEVAPADLEHMF